MWQVVLKERVLPWLEDFQPDLVFVSAGFDALGKLKYRMCLRVRLHVIDQCNSVAVCMFSIMHNLQLMTYSHA